MDNRNEIPQYGELNLPYSYEAEQSVIGAILLEPSCIDQVAQILPDSNYFHMSDHKMIYEVMLDMFIMGRAIDVVLLIDELEKHKDYNKDRDKSYLLQLAKTVPSISNVEHYAEIIKGKYNLRTLIITARELFDTAREEGADSADLLDLAEQKIYDIRQGKDIIGLQRVSEVILEVLERLDKLNSGDGDELKPISTGISELDQTITGLNRSDLILLAARPGMGKTSFALNISSFVAEHKNKKVAFFSLEMTKEQLATRLIASEAQIEGSKFRSGKIEADEWTRVIEAADIISKANLYLDDTARISVSEMKAKLRRLRGIDLVIIDYLQLMGGGGRIENRVQEISALTRNLKIMAKELNVPVILLSQLSRASEQRSDHRPLLSDLRDSGSIEQDADIVLFLYRDDYYASEDGSVDENINKNSGECIVAKNRHGETKSVKLHWQGEYMRFTGTEARYEENEY